MDIDSYILGRKSAGGGGSSLPAVTSEDNGDVLTVVNGAWDKAAPSGGIVVLHKDESTGALDKTWNEIRTLYEAGIPLYFVWEGTQFEDEIRAAFVDMVFSVSGEYYVSMDGLLSFIAFAANDYPVLDEG